MIQVKHYVNVKKIDKSVKDARDELIFFYKQLFNAEIFEHVAINCFKKRATHEVKIDKTAKKAVQKEIIIFLIHSRSSMFEIMIDFFVAVEIQKDISTSRRRFFFFFFFYVCYIRCIST